MASVGSAVEASSKAPAGAHPEAAPGKRILLISNRLMHYRVSVYNYFWRHFREHGWDFVVTTNEVQRENQNQCQFELIQKPFAFSQYRAEVKRLKPDAVILFLHMRDRIQWPLIHWLKLSCIPSFSPECHCRK